MTQMLRKQIYIGKGHQAVLKRLSRLRGLSESEVIRRAIEREASSGAEFPVGNNPQALEQIIAFALSRRSLGSSGQAYRFRRADSYEERLNRYGADAEAQEIEQP